MYAVILAGGRSHRNGRHKACRRYRARAWLAFLCRPLRRAGLGVRVVVGLRAAQASRCVPQGVRRRWNRAARHGSPLGSLQAGLWGRPEAVLVMPVDVPPPSGTLLGRLRHALRPEGACVPAYRGRRGHPVLLGARLAHRLRAADARTERLDRIVAGGPCTSCATQARSVRQNLNRPRDWRLYVRASRGLGKDLPPHPGRPRLSRRPRRQPARAGGRQGA